MTADACFIPSGIILIIVIFKIKIHYQFIFFCNDYYENLFPSRNLVYHLFYNLIMPESYSLIAKIYVDNVCLLPLLEMHDCQLCVQIPVRLSVRNADVSREPCNCRKVVHHWCLPLATVNWLQRETWLHDRYSGSSRSPKNIW